MKISTNAQRILNSIDMLPREDQVSIFQKLKDNSTQISTDNPWIKYAGMFKDDPQFDEFLSEIESYRHELDQIEK